MIVHGGILAPFVALAALGVILILNRRGTPIWRLLVVGLFCLYLWGVASTTLFPIELGFNEPREPASSWAVINLSPFSEAFDSRTVRMQSLLNVVLGIPLGILLPLLGVTAAARVMGLGLLFTLGIEALQFIENWGYGRQYRTVDINDVIFNWVGVALGYAAYRLVDGAFGRLRGGMSEASAP